MVGNRPVKWCAVSTDEVLARGKRLDASAYNVEARNAKAAIAGGRYHLVPLSRLVSRIYYGGRGKRNYVPATRKDAIGFIGSSEMLDCYPSPVKFMVNDASVDDLRVNCGDILISRSGTIGNMSFVNRTLSRFLVSEHAIRIQCEKQPGYVYTFLKSTTGQLLVKEGVFGAVILEVEPDHLVNIPIPDAPEEIKRKIDDLVVRSYELRDESNALIDKANSLMVEEMKLPPVEKMGGACTSFSVSSSDLAGRFDASYHVPIVAAVTKHLKRHAAEVTAVADPRISKKVILPPRFTRVYVEEGYGRPLIGGKQIHELDPSNKKFLSSSKHKSILSQLEVRTNTTLITRSGTIGKVALVPRHWDRWIPSDHIIRIVPANDGIAGYLNVFLSSEYAHPLIVRYTYGAVIDEIDDTHVRNIPVPLLKDTSVQDEINTLALAANEKRFEAYRLEQKALSIMETDVLNTQRP